MTSRYENDAAVPAVVYDTGTSVVLRVDSVHARRFTAWELPEQYHEAVTKERETLHSIAFKFYGDPLLWWLIADTNPLVPVIGELPSGTHLRFPRIEDVIDAL